MRRPDDDAKLARAVVQLAEEVKGIAHYLFDGDVNEDAGKIVARMDEIIASARSVNAHHALSNPAPEATVPDPAAARERHP